MYINPANQCRIIRTGSGHLGRLFAITYLLLTLASFAHAEPTLEHVDGLPNWADNDMAMSGDGQWAAWAYNNSATPWLRMVNLNSGDQTIVDLESTTGFSGLSFENDVYPDISHDGSRIAVVARKPGDPDNHLAFVVSASGAEIARLAGPDEYGDDAWFDEYIFIDASGRYITFTSNATRFRPVIGGITQPWSDTLEGWDSAFRLDSQTGEIKLVAIKPGGAELQDYSNTMGISDNGRFVLFQSYATSLPGANGDTRLYLRDMNSTAASAIALVSIKEDGTPIGSLACCKTVAHISDDGTRVIYTENLDSSDDGQEHTFLWTRDTGSAALTGAATELYAGYSSDQINLSGNGQWIATGGEDFSRFKVDDGSTDPLPNDGNGDAITLDDTRISANGEIIMFWNDQLLKPEGEDGRWWLLRYPAGPGPDTTPPQWPEGASLSLLQGPNSVQIIWPQASDDTAVTKYIVYRDGLEIAQLNASKLSYTDNYDASATFTYSVEASDAAGNESTDGPGAEIIVEYLPAIVVEVAETINVSDVVLVMKSVDISIAEVIAVTDSVMVLPSISVDLTETITVSDDIVFNVGPTLADTIKLKLPDGLLIPGSVFNAVAGGFKPFTPVLAFLQSEPVLVGEEMSDADGNVSFDITIPLDFTPGDHTLILIGQTLDGSERRLTAGITIVLPDTIFSDGFEQPK